jgi:hypothetical protein
LLCSQTPPKSKLAEAITYMLAQWRYITAYVRHGMAEIDTNWVENKIRPLALDRRNWLFIGDEDTGKVHALFYSLTASAIMNDLNPRIYIHYLLTRIHDIRRGLVDPNMLLPHTIDRNQIKEFSEAQIKFTKQVFNTS